jgi:hypothetical protein
MEKVSFGGAIHVWAKEVKVFLNAQAATCLKTLGRELLIIVSGQHSIRNYAPF